jgi:hypothetical protein
MSSDPAPSTDRDDRPQRGSNPRLKTKTTRVAMPKVAVGGTARLVNLSTTGACVEVEGLVEGVDQVELLLAHPSLTSVPQLQGEVMWRATETVTQTTRLGLRFADPDRANRAVRPFLTAEAGSAVLDEGDVVGFVVPHGKSGETYSVFDAEGKRLAVAARDEAGFQVEFKVGGAAPQRAGSLAGAVELVLDHESPLRAEPRLPGWRTQLAPEEVIDAAPLDDEPAPAVQFTKTSYFTAASPAPSSGLRVHAPDSLSLETRGKTSEWIRLEAPAPRPTAQAPEPEVVSLDARLPASKSAPRLTRGALWRAAIAVPALGLVGYAVHSVWQLVVSYTS